MIRNSTYSSLNTVYNTLKSQGQNATFTKKSLENLANSTDKDISQAAQDVLKDKGLVQLIDNSLEAADGKLNDGNFTLDALSATLARLKVDLNNPAKADLEALLIIREPLTKDGGTGPWTRKTLEALVNSANADIKTAAKRVLKDPNLLGLIDNGFSATQSNDGQFILGELDAAIAALNPQNPAMLVIDSLKTIRDAIHMDANQYPHGVMTKTQLESAANDPKADPHFRAACRQLLKQKDLFSLVDNGFSPQASWNDGIFQVEELDAAIQDLMPTNPRMISVTALETLKKEVSNKQKYPDGLMSMDQLKALAKDGSVKPEVRAAANRLLSEPEMLGYLHKTVANATDKLNDGKFSADSLAVAYSVFHPQNNHGRNMDALQTLENEIKNNPDKYPGGFITKDQLNILHQAGSSPQVRQAAHHLLRNSNGILDYVNNSLGDSSGKLYVQDFEQARWAYSHNNPDKQNERALWVLADALKNNPQKWGNGSGVYDKSALESILASPNAYPSLRAAAAQVLNKPELWTLLTGNTGDSFKLEDAERAKKTYSPDNAKFLDYRALRTLQERFDSVANASVITEEKLKALTQNPDPALKEAAWRLLNSPKLRELADPNHNGISLTEVKSAVQQTLKTLTTRPSPATQTTTVQADQTPAPPPASPPTAAPPAKKLTQKQLKAQREKRWPSLDKALAKSSKWEKYLDAQFIKAHGNKPTANPTRTGTLQDAYAQGYYERAVANWEALRRDYPAKALAQVKADYLRTGKLPKALQSLLK